MLVLPEGPWTDWDVQEFDSSRLRLAANHDLTYAHGLEVVFTDVAYLACPAQFLDPVFREPAPAERELVRAYVGEYPPVIVAFDVESLAGPGTLPCLIAAETVEIVVGTVHRRQL
ncbi:hypothetical protein [Actinoplanes couchii]|uniref:Uncharacterized protein n=1 Tax=Actinoplanes couchii TaxID=403638 RepID=A0ABQ3XU54_9ACTN|nr:hypothetical protein [Actinoplanes couchii]MDR6319399.1 hypothetical protein [Actinoplanes couchii]GID62049.1 hypothetical protein Aco03nite_104530 [Actinoplanes couchii]